MFFEEKTDDITRPGDKRKIEMNRETKANGSSDARRPRRLET